MTLKISFFIGNYAHRRQLALYRGITQYLPTALSQCYIYVAPNQLGTGHSQLLATT